MNTQTSLLGYTWYMVKRAPIYRAGRACACSLSDTSKCIMIAGQAPCTVPVRLVSGTGNGHLTRRTPTFTGFIARRTIRSQKSQDNDDIIDVCYDIFKTIH